MIFRSKKLKIDSSFKLKLSGKRLAPTKSVKYLWVLLDEHLHWNEQISQVKMKLHRAMGILSKLRYNANQSVWKIKVSTLWVPIMGAKDPKDTDYFSSITKLCP